MRRPKQTHACSGGRVPLVDGDGGRVLFHQVHADVFGGQFFGEGAQFHIDLAFLFAMAKRVCDCVSRFYLGVDTFHAFFVAILNAVEGDEHIAFLEAGGCGGACVDDAFHFKRFAVFDPVEFNTQPAFVLEFFKN